MVEGQFHVFIAEYRVISCANIHGAHGDFHVFGIVQQFQIHKLSQSVFEFVCGVIAEVIGCGIKGNETTWFKEATLTFKHGAEGFKTGFGHPQLLLQKIIFKDVRHGMAIQINVIKGF